MGEFHDLGHARREKDEKRGIKPTPIDKLADSLGLRGDQPSKLTVEDIEQIASSSEDQDVRSAARQLSDLLHERVQEVVDDQNDKEDK